MDFILSVLVVILFLQMRGQSKLIRSLQRTVAELGERVTRLAKGGLAHTSNYVEPPIIKEDLVLPSVRTAAKPMDSFVTTSDLGDHVEKKKSPPTAAVTQPQQASRDAPPADLSLNMWKKDTRASADTPLPAAIIVSPPAPVASTSARQSAPPPRPPRQSSPQWEAFKRKLMDNWTGLLGSVILVAGTVFFGILAANYFGPPARFALILSLAALLFGINFWVRRYGESWQEFGSWLQSAAAAIFLFDCYGAGHIGGLRLVTSENGALALLLTGIALNLTLAWMVRLQAIASLHVILSLVVLAFIPQNLQINIIGFVVALAGVALSYRSRWDFHLLLILLAYYSFDAHWIVSLSSQPALSGLWGKITCLGIGLAGALVHYRKSYQSKTFQPLPLFVHLTNWAGMAVGLILSSRGSPYTAYYMAGGAVLLFSLAQVARKKQISWLYNADMLVGQSLFLFAVMKFHSHGHSAFSLLCIALIETVLFTTLVACQKVSLLRQIGTVMSSIGIAAVAVAGIYAIFIFNSPALSDVYAALVQKTGRTEILRWLMACALASLSHQIVLRRFSIDANDSTSLVSPIAISAPIFMSLGYILVHEYLPATLCFCALIYLYNLFRQQHPSTSTACGFHLMIFVAHVTSWVMIRHINMPALEHAWIVAPVLVLDFLLLTGKHLLVPNTQRTYQQVVVLLATAHTALAGWFLLKNSHALAPGMAYLALSLLLSEASHALAKPVHRFFMTEGGRLANYILHSAHAFLLLFLVCHFSIHIQSERLYGILPQHALIATLAVAVMLYQIWREERATELLRDSVSLFLNSNLLEILLGLSLVTISLSVRTSWHAVLWASMAIVLLLGAVRLAWSSRLYLYSWLLFIASLVEVSIVMMSGATPSDSTWLRPTLPGITALVLQLGFIVFALHEEYFAKLSQFPRHLAQLSRVQRGISCNTNAFLLTPFIVVLAFNTYWFSLPISGFAAGIFYLVYALIALELSIWQKIRYDKLSDIKRPVLHRALLLATYFFTACFLGRHFLVHIASEYMLGIVPLHALIALFALACMIYIQWRQNQALDRYTGRINSWTSAILLETMLILLTATISLSMAGLWHPAVWASLALLLTLGTRYLPGLSRLNFYAWLYYLIGLVQISIITSSVMPGQTAWEGPQRAGLIALLPLVAYIIAVYRSRCFESVIFPTPLGALRRLNQFVAANMAICIFYPLAVAVGLFFYWTFDRTLLTTLWVSEIFALFSLGVIVRQRHFIYASYVFLIGCLLKLIANDLSGNSIAIKALTCMIVGGLMVTMNAIWRRYKTRM